MSLAAKFFSTTKNPIHRFISRIHVFFEDTWRIIPVSKWLVTPIYKPFRPFGRETTLLLTTQILQVITQCDPGFCILHPPSPSSQLPPEVAARLFGLMCFLGPLVRLGGFFFRKFDDYIVPKKKHYFCRAVSKNLCFGLILPRKNRNHLGICLMFDVANYTTADLLDIRMTQYDPKDHEQDPGDRLPLYYYVIRIPGWAKIADNVPPAPQRANQARGLPAIEHIMIIHTSNPGGARGILTEPKIAPWGEATAKKEGGEYRCCEFTRESGTVHHQKAKVWVTNTNSHILTGLAFPVTAIPPT